MADQVFIRREPVINRHKAIIATRLVVHAASVPSAAAALRELDGVWPAVSALAHSVIVALEGCEPNPELLAWAPPANVMLEIPAAALKLPATRQLIARLDESGNALCLSGYDCNNDLPDIPFRFLLADFFAQPNFDDPPALPLAQYLPDLATFDSAISSGYAGATGWFFLRCECVWGPLKTNHAQIMRVLNLVRRNGTISEIEMALKKDVTLSFKLLRYINSPAFGYGKEIQSFRHAVTLLGYDQLNKWLSLLLVTASKSPVAPALMQTAIARGRFMETIGAGRFDASQRDNLFITGAFSLLDRLLGTRMAEILAEMQLPAAITDTLTDRGGEFAPYLALALACEKDNPAQLSELAGQLDLHAATVNQAQLEALAFAASLQLD
jgi:EAL and modified HD-GYP domain-containing signal transduction protein